MNAEALKVFFNRHKFKLPVLLIYAASILVLMNSPLREFWQRRFAPPQRKVLAVASGSMFRDGQIQRVVKVLTPDGISVEVYGPLEKGVQALIDTIFISDRRDAFFDLQGRATNLALKDMNADGRPEIIAPTYDQDGIAHLNVYSFDSDTNKFSPYLN